MKRRVVVGVDEVGRGPIAGPVTVGAFSCERKNLAKLVKDAELFAGCRLRDSKKLTPARRALFSKFIHDAAKQNRCSIKVVSKSAALIDTKGISFCLKACTATGIRFVAPNTKDTDVLLDAGLKAPAEYDSQKSIVKGDEKEPAIAFASIVAKEWRDSYMKRVAKKISQYGFDAHVGYGTRAHYAAIDVHGFHKEHRMSFLKKYCAQGISRI